MAIDTENLEGGFVRTYSTTGMMIEREGIRYVEAIDPADAGRVYTETDEPVEGHEPMKYSTLSIKRELDKLIRDDGISAWKRAKVLLQDAEYWDDFILANYLSEQDEVFKTACGTMVERGIVTKAELDALLPKCVWTAE